MVLFNFDKSYPLNNLPTESGYFHINTSGNSFEGPILVSNTGTLDLEFEDAAQRTVRLVPAIIGYPGSAGDYLTRVAELVYANDFQPPSTSGLDLTTSGEVVYSGLSFENASDLATFTTSGTGSASQSGQVSPGLLDSFSVGVRGSSTTPAVYYLEPNIASATGIDSGRCIFLTEYPTLSEGANHTITLNCVSDVNNRALSIRFEKYSNDQHGIGYLNSDYYSSSSVNTIRTTWHTPGPSFKLVYSGSPTETNNNRLRWFCVDWELVQNSPQTDYFLVDIYTLVHQVGYTINDVITKSYPVLQMVTWVPAAWAGYDSSKPPRFIFRNRSNSAEAAVLDSLYLEKFPNGLSQNYGTHRLSYGDPSVTVKELSYILNTQPGSGIGALQEVHANSYISYLEPSKSYFDTVPGGFYGLGLNAGPTNTNVPVYIPNTENIKSGIIRVAMRANNGKRSRFYVLRTGDINLNNSYYFSLTNAGAASMSCQIFKNGSAVATTALPVAEDQYFWELRWKVTELPSAKVELEILQGDIDKSGITFDDPTEVYTKLSTVVSYTDLVSPIIPTSSEEVALELKSDNASSNYDWESHVHAWIGVYKVD